MEEGRQWVEGLGYEWQEWKGKMTCRRLGVVDLLEHRKDALSDALRGDLLDDHLDDRLDD